MCLILGQATSFVAAYLHSDKSKLDVTAQSLVGLIAALEAGFVVFFAVFIASMAPKYRLTFFSTVTAKQFNIARFRNATSDSARHAVFGLHPSHYAEIRDDVKRWVGENFSIWVDEAPEWFDDHKKNRIPIDMIPESEVVKKKNSSFGAKEKKSITRSFKEGAAKVLDEVARGRAQETRIPTF